MGSQQRSEGIQHMRGRGSPGCCWSGAGHARWQCLWSHTVRLLLLLLLPLLLLLLLPLLGLT